MSGADKGRFAIVLPLVRPAALRGLTIEYQRRLIFANFGNDT